MPDEKYTGNLPDGQRWKSLYTMSVNWDREYHLMARHFQSIRSVLKTAHDELVFCWSEQGIVMCSEPG